MDFEDKRKNHVNFLVQAANVLPAESHFHKLLRSYYLTKCKRLSETSNNINQNNLFSEEEMCKKCSTPWFDANFSLSIAPIKATKRRAQKIHKQIEKKTSRKGESAKKLSTKVNNTVTISCKLCKTKNKVVLWKKSSVSKKNPKDEKDMNLAAKGLNIIDTKASNKVRQEPLPKKESKKKRKRDKNAGLLYSINKDDHSVKAVANIKQKLQHLNNKKPSLSTPSNQNRKIHQNLNKQPQIQSKVTMKAATAKKCVKNHPQSAAKRNNLLQLAKALKTKANQSSTNSQADKLKQLLS